MKIRSESAKASRLALILALLWAFGCSRKTASDRGAEPSAPNRDRAASPIVSVAQSCVSTAPERCFDAVDNNCNGLVDEGCGIETGPLEFAIAWEPATVDIDLLVTDPNGELAEVGHPLSSGLVKQRDCPGRAGECHGQNLEKVYAESGNPPTEPPRGTYKVRIVLENLAGATPPIRVEFGARVGARSYGQTIKLERPQSGYEAYFAL